jgi:hypothetical protein
MSSADVLAPRGEWGLVPTLSMMLVEVILVSSAREAGLALLIGICRLIPAG